MKFATTLAIVLPAMMALGACSSSSNSDLLSAASEDSSASGAAASAVGGSLSNSSGNGTVSLLGTACPSLHSSNGSGANSCSSTSNVATLNYTACSFGSSAATWTGDLKIDFSGGTTLSCGTFPTPTNDTLRRQFVTTGGAASTGARTSAKGNVVTIDDTTSGIYGNYQSDTFNGSGASGFTFTTFNSGGGKEVTFASGKRTSVTVAEHLSAATSSGTAIWDHTVAGTVNLSETGSGASAQWSANSGTITAGACSGGMTVYHNRAKVMGQTCFQNVTYSTSCCTPVSGTIVTTFSKTSASGSGTLANALNGQSETLTITGCGTATYSALGLTTTVAMGSCF